jgi:hypothetical protein
VVEAMFVGVVSGVVLCCEVRWWEVKCLVVVLRELEVRWAEGQRASGRLFADTKGSFPCSINHPTRHAHLIHQDIIKRTWSIAAR